MVGFAAAGYKYEIRTAFDSSVPMPTRPPRSYGSFCPVAQASEVVAQRWVPLVLREIMVGCHRFNEIRRALPLISPSVLAQRLKSLEDDGVIIRRRDPGGATYHLTGAGEELRPIVDALGHWARKWITRDYRAYELDPGVLMWTLRRHVVAARFPAGRSVLHFRLEGAPPRRRYWWIVVERREDVDVCMTDPGHPVTLTVTAKARAIVDLLMEDAELGESLRQGLLVLEGDRELARRFETLFDFEGGSGSFTGGAVPHSTKFAHPVSSAITANPPE
jgi:DNA-binding HxlR family transcriptional regulator